MGAHRRFRWGTGALQELDHPPLLAPVTKLAATVRHVDQVGDRVADAFAARLSRRTGDRCSSTSRWTSSSAAPTSAAPTRTAPRRPHRPDEDELADIAELLGAARRTRCSSSGPTSGPTAPRTPPAGSPRPRGLPVIANGMGRGILPPGHPLLVTRARSVAFGQADLVVVVGTPLDFRLGYGAFGGARRGSSAAKVVHLADSAGQLADHVALAASRHR